MSDRPPAAPPPRFEDVPAPFRPWLDAWLPGDAPRGVDAALEAGLGALAAALHPQGRERGGAFDLLAADALVTTACELAVEQPDPGGALEEVLERVGRVEP